MLTVSQVFFGAFYSVLKKAWHEYFQGTLFCRDEAEAILDVTINLIKGSAVQTIFQPKKDYAHKLKPMWKEYIAAVATPRIQEPD